MSFESWENSLHDSFYGHDEYEPDEDCPCGCEGEWDVCEYDPQEEAEMAEAEHELDKMEYESIPPSYRY